MTTKNPAVAAIEYALNTGSDGMAFLRCWMRAIVCVRCHTNNPERTLEVSAWDKGKSAARRGLSRQSNPYNHPDRQTGSSMDWERLASEWDEGFDGFDPEQDAQERSERARKAALARWKK